MWSLLSWSLHPSGEERDKNQIKNKSIKQLHICDRSAVVETKGSHREAVRGREMVLVRMDLWDRWRCVGASQLMSEETWSRQRNEPITMRLHRAGEHIPVTSVQVKKQNMTTTKARHISSQLSISPYPRVTTILASDSRVWF